jgi:glycosyltransferase involved in cell wall biosynthesis
VKAPRVSGQRYSVSQAVLSFTSREYLTRHTLLIFSKPPESKNPRIVFLVTAAVTLRFLDGIKEALCARGYRVVLISARGALLQAAQDAGFETHAVDMVREISAVMDLRSLWQLVQLFRQLRPEVVVAGTPKAGLLGTLAARLTGVPRIVYQMHGLRSETLHGGRRWLVAIMERASAHFAHITLCVSHSLRDRARQLRILPAGEGEVLGKGSPNGIVIEEFAATAERGQRGRQLRQHLGWSPRDRVIGFVGRWVRDKGIEHLVAAFSNLSQQDNSLRLLLIGGYEEGDGLPPAVRAQIASHPAIAALDWADPIAPWYAAMDVFAFPTCREGLPTVLLEAQAAELPVVATRVTGVVDAVQEGKTAILVEQGEIPQLEEAIRRVLADDALAREMGRAGAEWVRTAFAREAVVANYVDFYDRLLHSPDQDLARESSDAEDGARAMVQSKSQVSVLRLIMPVASVCLILASQVISQAVPIDRTVTATANRSVTFSAGSVAPGVPVSIARTQSHTAMMVSPPIGSPMISSSPPRANASSSPTALRTPAGSSSSGPITGGHTDVRSAQALGFTSSLSVQSGTTMGFTARPKSPEHSPVQVGVDTPVAGDIFATSGSMFPGSRQRGFVFPSTGHHPDIGRNTGSTEAKTSRAPKSCKEGSLNCIADSMKKQPKHNSAWNALHPEQIPQ